MTGFDDGWRRSTFCDTSACLYVKVLPDGGALLRTEGPGVLTLSPAEWRAFRAGVRAGEFDEESHG